MDCWERFIIAYDIGADYLRRASAWIFPFSFTIYTVEIWQRSPLFGVIISVGVIVTFIGSIVREAANRRRHDVKCMQRRGEVAPKNITVFPHCSRQRVRGNGVEMDPA